MKKNKLLSLVAFTACLATLASCDYTARTRYANKDEKIAETTVEVDGNTMETLFKKIYSDSSYSSDIKDMFNEQIAINNLGEYQFRYEKSTDTYSVDLIIGQDANNNDIFYSEATNEQKQSFLSEHKAYWNWEDTGISITLEDKFDSTLMSQYDARIQEICTLAFDQVIQEVFTTWCGGSYRNDDRYYEILFAKDVSDKLYNLNDEDGNALPNEELTKLYVSPDYSFESVQGKNSPEVTQLMDGTTLDGFSYGLLVDDSYDLANNSTNIYKGEKRLIHLYRYVDYINATIMPTIQSNLLVEQYIFENQYPSVGITQQRKIAYIEISDNDSKKAKSLLTNYAEQYLSKLAKDEEIDFSIASDAWKAINISTTTEYPNSYKLKGTTLQISKDTFGEATTDCPNKNFVEGTSKYIDGKDLNAYSYYEGSKYASIINDYAKLTTNPSSNDSSTYTSFTSINSRTYTPIQGLKVKTDSLAAENYITAKKWGLKSDFSSLPSDVTSKLFNYQLVSEVSSSKKSDKAYDGQYLKSFTAGGVTFLKKDTYSKTDEYDSIIWSDSDKYYIIAVYDCVASGLIMKSSTNDDMSEIESKARMAGYTLASGSTFTNDAIEHYIAESEIIYFDQKVYDYFVETFPDVFD